jgi:hypothetical protein
LPQGAESESVLLPSATECYGAATRIGGRGERDRSKGTADRGFFGGSTRGCDGDVAYLVIIVLVAAAGIIRLWLQQRRQVSQMDTIEGFSSALEAMAPRFTRRGARGRAARRRAPRRRSLKGWLVAQPAHARRRMAVRREIEARRIASHRTQRGAQRAAAARARRGARAVGRGSRSSPRRTGAYAKHARSETRRATPPRRINRGRSSGQQGWAR